MDILKLLQFMGIPNSLLAPLTIWMMRGQIMQILKQLGQLSDIVLVILFSLLVEGFHLLVALQVGIYMMMVPEELIPLALKFRKKF
ncbi:hypothetical protein ES703_21122 [subsurface metagenome]